MQSAVSEHWVALLSRPCTGILICDLFYHPGSKLCVFIGNSSPFPRTLSLVFADVFFFFQFAASLLRAHTCKGCTWTFSLKLNSMLLVVLLHSGGKRGQWNLEEMKRHQHYTGGSILFFVFFFEQKKGPNCFVLLQPPCKRIMLRIACWEKNKRLSSSRSGGERGAALPLSGSSTFPLHALLTEPKHIICVFIH